VLMLFTQNYPDQSILDETTACQISLVFLSHSGITRFMTRADKHRAPRHVRHTAYTDGVTTHAALARRQASDS